MKYLTQAGKLNEKDLNTLEKYVKNKIKFYIMYGQTEAVTPFLEWKFF